MVAGIALVTGGGRGIGAATAQLLASQGWAVAVNYAADAVRAEQVVRGIREAGGRALAVQADVARADQVERMFAAVDEGLGRLTALINSAGIAGNARRVQEMDAAELERMFAVNITGTLLCCKEAVRRMSTAHGGAGGAIVNLSSVAARLGAPGGGVHYAASKGAIDSLTFGMAQELAPEGIRVNAVRPGVVDTEMQPSGRVAELGPKLPMRRAGEAREVAQAIAWLAGNTSSYVAGAIVDVSGAR